MEEESDDQPVHILDLGDERMVREMARRTQSLEQNLNFGSEDDVNVEQVVKREKTELSTRDVNLQNVC